MAKQILLYGEIFDYSAGLFMENMEDAKDDDITLRINTIGGDPESGFGMIGKWKEHTGEKKIQVDGKAFSMGTFFLCYVDYAEALDVSQFLLHRAAYPEWLEASESYFTDSRRKRLENANKSLRKALESKIDVAEFEKISKVTMDELFSMEARVEVILDAKQAKKIGLINKINKITPEIQASIESCNGEMIKMAAKHVPSKEADDDKTSKKSNENFNTMDVQKLKSEHPGLYAQIFEAGVAQGISTEKERIGAWMAFADIDLKTVTEGINGEKAPSAKDMAELTRKGISAAALENIEGDAPKDVNTPPVDDKIKDDKQKEIESFEASIKTNLNLKS